MRYGAAIVTKSLVLCEKQSSPPLAVHNLASILRSLTETASDLDSKIGSVA